MPIAGAPSADYLGNTSVKKKRATVLRRFSGELDVDRHTEANVQRIFDLRNAMKEAMES